MKNKIIILSGDPNSINSEIIYKSWKKLNFSKRKNIYVISNYTLLKRQFKILKYPINLEVVTNINQKATNDSLKILDISLNFKDPFNVPFKSSSKFIKKSFNLAHELALNKHIKGIINCPISKNLLERKNQGVTEFLASKCKIKNGSEVMLIKSKFSSVSPITTHIKLKDVSKRITSNLIEKKILTINKWFKKIYNKKPLIGLLGLNPHNAEYEKNSEEVKIIIPSVKKLRIKGIKVLGPLVADTIFIKDFKKYDVIVGMYHDQVLAPFKSLFNFDAINITLGLKYLRLSPDHGVAKNIIKKKIADSTSLSKCIDFLIKLK